MQGRLRSREVFNIRNKDLRLDSSVPLRGPLPWILNAFFRMFFIFFFVFFLINCRCWEIQGILRIKKKLGVSLYFFLNFFKAIFKHFIFCDYFF